jgi:hypothetical protein
MAFMEVEIKFAMVLTFNFLETSGAYLGLYRNALTIIFSFVILVLEGRKWRLPYSDYFTRLAQA